MPRLRLLAALALLALALAPLGKTSSASDRELSELDRRLAERVSQILEARAYGRLSAAGRLPELPELGRSAPPAAPAARDLEKDPPGTR